MIDSPAPTPPSETTGPTRWAIVRILARDVALLAAAAIVLEILLQCFAPEYSRNLFDAQFTGGYPVAVDERGFRRSAPEPCSDAKGTLAVGDSVTFGTGIPWSDTWPSVLQHQLADRGLPACVINTAAPATRVADITYGLNGPWADLKFDTMILGATGNMVSLAWIRRDEAPKVRNHAGSLGVKPSSLPQKLMRRVKALCLPSFVRKSGESVLYRIGLLNHNVAPDAPYGAMLAHGWRQVGLPPERAQEAWTCFESELRGLRDAVNARGGVLIVTYVPSRFTISTDARDNAKAVPLKRLSIDPVARTADICERLGISFVDVREPLRTARAGSDHFLPLYVQQDYTHLNVEGHAAVAGALGRFLKGRRGSDPGSAPSDHRLNTDHRGIP